MKIYAILQNSKKLILMDIILKLIDSIIVSLITEFIIFFFKKIAKSFQHKLTIMRRNSLRGKNTARAEKRVQVPLSFFYISI